MGILDIFSGLAKPITNLVDELHTSEEEKAQIKLAISRLELEAQKQVLDFQSKLVDADIRLKEAQSSIILAEAQGQSWMQRNWRPYSMAIFGIAIIINAAGLFPNPLPDLFYQLYMLGFGGYIGGRTFEKYKGVEKNIIPSFKSKK